MNEAEWSLFSRDNKVIKNIPHTKEALKQNALRSIIQSLKWQQSLCKDFDGRDACQWGWEKEESKTIPLQTDLPQALNICRERVECGCKKGCTRQCKCLTSELKCKELCRCFGQYANGKSC